VLNVTTGKLSTTAKVGANKLSESRRVVVSDSFRVAECFEHGIRLDDLIFECGLFA